MRNYFILDGVDSRDFGVYISGQGTFSAPQKAYTFYNVPGRNGALLGSEHRLENINVSYEAFIYTDFDNQLAAFRSFLLSIDGYAKLSDSYHPDEYRYAVYQGPFEPTVERTNDAGKFVITFSCKPQRFLTDGDTWYKWAGNYMYLNGSEINGQNTVDSSYMTLQYKRVVTDQESAKVLSPYSSSYLSLPNYVEINVNGTPVWSYTKNTSQMALTFNLVSGTGSVTEKYIDLPKTSWTRTATNTFRHSVSGVSSLVWCNQYSLDSSKNYHCWYSSGYFYVYNPQYDDATQFMNFLASASTIQIWVVLSTPESISFTSYAPSFSAPYTLEVLSGTSSATKGKIEAFEYADVSLRYYNQTTTSNMENPTVFKSQPVIRVYGNGSFTVNNITVTVTNATTYTDIDCEMMDCYEGSTNRNNDVSFSTYDFPVLEPGSNPVTIVSGITEVDIQPRWWRV